MRRQYDHHMRSGMYRRQEDGWIEPMFPYLSNNLVSTSICTACALLAALTTLLWLNGLEFRSNSRDWGLNFAPTSCAPTDVKGLRFCPRLADLMPILLENKRALLRLALDALTGEGTKEPLQLVSRMALNTVDALYSPIAGSGPQMWNRGLPPGACFIDWLETFYTKKLHRRRPVLMYVTGGDVCSLLEALTTPSQGFSARNDAHKTSAPNLSISLEMKESHRSCAYNAVATPLALMTVGWDDDGSPFCKSRWHQCALDILGLPQVVRWFVSHHARGDPGPKVEYIGLGFGSNGPRSGLKQSPYVDAARKRLRMLESCDDSEAGTLDLLFMCNGASSNTHRPAINAVLYARGQAAKVVPENRYPMEPAATLSASTEGLFAISPGGTRPDCFRHYEFLLAGNIVYVTDHPSLRAIFANLPVVFVQGGAKGWANITCDVMEEHALAVARQLQQALEPRSTSPPFQFEKLTLRYWEIFVRDRVWAAGALYANNNLTVSAVIEPSATTEVYEDLVVGPSLSWHP